MFVHCVWSWTEIHLCACPVTEIVKNRHASLFWVYDIAVHKTVKNKHRAYSYDNKIISHSAAQVTSIRKHTDLFTTSHHTKQHTAVTKEHQCRYCSKYFWHILYFHEAIFQFPCYQYIILSPPLSKSPQLMVTLQFTAISSEVNLGFVSKSCSFTWLNRRDIAETIKQNQNRYRYGNVKLLKLPYKI